MGTLADDVIAAEAMGLSYGYYKALMRDRELKAANPRTEPKKPKPRRKRYKDEDAFALWQKGLNDAQIGAALGVSRQIIQRWRDNMELPSITKENVETQKYRLVETKDGLFVLHEND